MIRAPMDGGERHVEYPHMKRRPWWSASYQKARTFFMQAQTLVGAQPADLSDGVLIERVLADDQRAFEVLVKRYQAPLFQAIYHVLGDYHEAHDVLQQVLLQLYLTTNTRKRAPAQAMALASCTKLVYGLLATKAPYALL